MKTGVADISACAKREVLPLLDHLVGASMQGRRNGEAKRFGSLEIDDQFERGRLLDRQFGATIISTLRRTRFAANSGSWLRFH